MQNTSSDNSLANNAWNNHSKESLKDTHENLKNPKNTQKNYKNTKNVQKNYKINNPKNSNIIYCNIRGIIPGLRRDKLIYLSTVADELNASFIKITESHLNETNTEAETYMPGWQQIRADRILRQKGGVIMYIRDQLTVEYSLTFSNSFVEFVALFIPSLDLALVTVYRPPAVPAIKFSEALIKIDNWIEDLEKILGKTPNIIVSGDFNFPGMGTWTTTDMDYSATNASTRAVNTNMLGNSSIQVKKLIDTVHKNAFSQVVKIPTRIENILDLMFVNNQDLVENIETIENILITDHKLIVANLSTQIANLKEEKRRNFCSTTIPLYNLHKTTPEQWAKARDELSKIKVDQEASPSKITEELIVAL